MRICGTLYAYWCSVGNNLSQYCLTLKGVKKPILGTRIVIRNINKEEMERIRNEFLKETKLYETADSSKYRG